MFWKRIRPGLAALAAGAWALTLIACAPLSDAERIDRKVEIYGEAEEMPAVNRGRALIVGDEITLPQGLSTRNVDRETVESITGVLATVTEAAIQPGGIATIVYHLSEEDRERLEWEMDFDRVTETETSLTRAFKEIWANQYGGDFEIAEQQRLLDRRALEVAEGDIFASWPMDPVPQFQATPSGEVLVRTRELSLQRGKRVAVAVLPAEEGASEVLVSFVREYPNRWKIDIPDDVTAQQLRDNLQNLVSSMVADLDYWPDRERDAYRMLTRRVVLALYDADRVRILD